MEDCNTCNIKEAHHSEDIKKSLINRLKRIEGQVRGVSKMVEDDVYCDDVLHQVMSIESAIKGVKKGLLEAHIKSCVVDQIQNNKMEVVDELVDTIGKMIK